MNEETQETTEVESQDQTTEASQTPEAESPASDVSSSSEASAAAETPAHKTAKDVAEWDAKTSYDALQKNYDQVSKSYNELRREFTRRTQNESSLQKKIDSLTEIINKATETPIDPKQFFNDLQTHGVKALDPLFEKRSQSLKDEFSKQVQEVQMANETLQYEVGKLQRRADTVNYPDFQKLEPIMAELVQDEKIALDFGQGANVVLDNLYKLARSLNADKAVQDAKALGKQEAEKLAAKEAGASTARGGKAGVVTDPASLSLDEHRKMLIAQIGEADQDGQ